MSPSSAPAWKTPRSNSTAIETGDAIVLQGNMQSIELFVRTVIGRAYPRIVGSVREASGILWEAGLPLLSVTAFVYVYRALNAPEAYIGFVVMGGAMTAFWLNILWSMASQLYWDKDQGNLALYILAPGSMMAILLGMALGGLLWTLTRALLIVIAGVAAVWRHFFDRQPRRPVSDVRAHDGRPVRYGHALCFTLFVLWA